MPPPAPRHGIPNRQRPAPDGREPPAPTTGPRPPGPPALSRAPQARRRAVALASVVVVSGGLVAGALALGGSRQRSRNAATTASRPHRAPRAAVVAHRPSPPARRRPRRYLAPFRVGVAALELHEPASVATATGHSATGQPVRTVPTVVRYPTAGRADGREHPGAAPLRPAGSFPLVVFSQGFDTPVADYGGLLDSWARDGYVVAAPTYPHTDPTSAGAVDESDIVNHPADLRYVLSAVLSLSRSGHGPLHGVIDPRRIAVAGQSDGGDVSLAVAANTCCEMPALSAAIILSGAELPAFGGRYYGGRRVPLLVVQGDADTINPRGCSATLYDGASPPKFYLELFGAEHLPPYVDAGPTRATVAATVSDFLAAYLAGRRPARVAMARDADVAGVSRLTSTATAPVAQTVCPP